MGGVSGAGLFEVRGGATSTGVLAERRAAAGAAALPSKAPSSSLKNCAEVCEEGGICNLATGKCEHLSPVRVLASRAPTTKELNLPQFGADDVPKPRGAMPPVLPPTPGVNDAEIPKEDTSS